MLTFEDYLALLRPLEKLGFIYNLDADKEENVITYCVKDDHDFVRIFYTNAIFDLFQECAASVVVGLRSDVTIML